MSKIERVMHKAYDLGIQDLVFMKVAEISNYQKITDLTVVYEQAFEQVKQEFSYVDTNNNQSTLQST